jgi:hypothetical protein
MFSSARTGPERLPDYPVHILPAKRCAKQSLDIYPVRQFLGRQVGNNRHCAV